MGTEVNLNSSVSSIRDTVFPRTLGEYPVWDGPAIFPGEMRESPDAFVAKSVHWRSSVEPYSA